MRWAERPGRQSGRRVPRGPGQPGRLGPLRAGGGASILIARAPLRVERQEVLEGLLLVVVDPLRLASYASNTTRGRPPWPFASHARRGLWRSVRVGFFGS